MNMVPYLTLLPWDAGNAYKVKEPATEAGKLQVVENEADLWIQLTNSIVRPLIADLRASLGLSPQLGLMSLPMELADRILSQLKVPALYFLSAYPAQQGRTAQVDSP